jgi:hypothetical protein
MSSTQHRISAVPGATSGAPGAGSTDDTLETLERAFLDARSSFYSAKSIVDLITQHDLTKHAGEATYAVSELLAITNKKLEQVELQLRRMAKGERQA